MSQHTVLVADDEVLVLQVVAGRLREAGFSVLTATDGTAALRLARDHAPSLVVADIRMPGLRGDELGAALAADPRTEHIPVVLLGTPFHAADPGLPPLPDAVRRVLPKPVRPRDVLVAVCAVLDERDFGTLAA